MFKKLVLLILALLLSMVFSCANVHVNYVRTWPRVISDAAKTTVVIQITRPKPPIFCISVFEDDCKSKDEGPEYVTVAYGTGFVISSDGQVVTNFHVIFPEVKEEDTKIWVKFRDKRSFLVKKTYSCPLHDLAILKIDAKDLPTVRLEVRQKLREGIPVVSAGYKYADDLSFSEGMVSSLRAVPDGVFVQYRWVVTTVLIYPGFSGGPVFNKYGNVVGINNAVYEDRPGLGLIIPVKHLLEVLNRELYADTLEKLNKIAEYYDELDGTQRL